MKVARAIQPEQPADAHLRAGLRPRMQLWHGTADSTLRFPNFGEEVKAVSQTPSVTDSPRPGWTRTRYGGTGVLAPVERSACRASGHGLG